jgi:hypothetical protein
VPSSNGKHSLQQVLSVHQESEKDCEATPRFYGRRCGHRNLYEDHSFSPRKDVEACEVCAPKPSQDAEAEELVKFTNRYPSQINAHIF